MRSESEGNEFVRRDLHNEAIKLKDEDGWAIKVNMNSDTLIQK